MGYALLTEKPLLGPKVAPRPKSALERATDRWFVREKSSTRVGCASDKGLPGQYYDEETGLHHNGFRTYDPAIGRYIQSDPVGISGGINTYSYVAQNPIVYIDPFGTIRWKGTYGQVSAFFFFGAQFAEFTLTSDCVNDKQATVDVWAVGPGFGIGASLIPADASGGQIEFEDNRSGIDISVFNGFYVSYQAGLTLGTESSGVNFVNLGEARNVDFISNGRGLNFSAGIYFVEGSSTVINAEINDCNSCGN